MAESTETIAQLKQENQELRAELRLLSDALNSMGHGLCMIDGQGSILYSNPCYSEVLGLPGNEIHPGMTCAEQIELGVRHGHYPPDLEPAQIEQMMWDNLARDDASRLPFMRGERVYTIHPRPTEQGNLVITFEDATAREEAERAARASEMRLGSVLDAMLECVMILDENAKPVYVNPRGLELLEAPSLEVLLSSNFEPVPPEFGARALAVHRQVIAGETVSWTFALNGMQGRQFHVEANEVPFQMPDGSRAHLSILRDIDKRYEAERALRHSEARLRLIQEVTGLADIEIGPDRIARFTRQFAEQAGLPAGTTSMTYEEWCAIVHPDDRERLDAETQRWLEQGEIFRTEFRIVRPDNGDIRWISSIAKVERDEQGAVIRTNGAHLDITERRRAEDALRESEERFRLAAEASCLGVWDYDPVSGKREWSSRLIEIWGFSPDVEPSMKLACEQVHPDDREKFQKLLFELRDGTGANRFESTFRITRLNDRAERWVAMNGWRAESPGGLIRMIVTARDVTDEKTADDRIRWSATHDALTRLANRSSFHDQLNEALRLARKAKKSVGLLTIDLDHFKQINDALGHAAGDEFLQAFARRLRAATLNGEVVARLSGDEFAILVPDLPSQQQLSNLCSAIHEKLREPFIQHGRLLDCRISIGAAIYPQHATTVKELMISADMALYAAKRGGRSTTVIYSPLLRVEVQRDANMVKTARMILQDDRIVPFYQPKLDLANGSVAGFETLLRWRDKRNRVHLPVTIEAAFEDHEVAQAISDRMIEGAIADMRGWLEQGVSFGHVAVNASAAEFRRDDFAERVLESLRRNDIPRDCFQLEVTETVFLGRGAEFVQRALALLSSEGIKIALDDFGTGYASLRHLKQFPVDIIKIDQSFVRDMEFDSDDDAIIRAVINLGKNLGIKVVAEGIENLRQAERLIELGCDFGQGFLFSKAVPANDVPALVAHLPRQMPSSHSLSIAQKLRLVVGQN